MHYERSQTMNFLALLSVVTFMLSGAAHAQLPVAGSGSTKATPSKVPQWDNLSQLCL